jgi:type I restriction enzyme M protein
MAKATKRNNATAASVGYEAELWRMADALRGSMDAAEDTHVALGLIFLKYISDAFDARRTELERLTADPESDWYEAEPADREAVVEDRDAYAAARTSSGCRRRPAGHSSRRTPSSRRSAG